MNKLLTILIILTALLYGCKTVFPHACKKMIYPEETPFMVVVKLKSAEKSLDYDKAMEYIDVNQVYAISEDPISDWKKMLKFYFNLGKDKKFSNSFNYSEYIIKEKINDDRAFVIFKGEGKGLTKEIKYVLENRNNHWIVIDIKYKNMTDRQ